MHRMRSAFVRLIRTILALVVVFYLGPAVGMDWEPVLVHGQEPDDFPVSPAYADEVADLMARMSTAAKVGQLFIVSFPGSEVTDESLIAELLRDYRVGGVVLEPTNGNIINEGDTPTRVAALVSQLQEAAWAATRPVTESQQGEQVVTYGIPVDIYPAEPFVPLLVAVSYAGNGMPFTSITNGMTPIPSQMALGATWNPAYAEMVGNIVGEELSTLGINMLLGPSLDVLETPHPTSAGDLGVRAFGGDPFWVGQMGQAYIRGVHTGSKGRLAVVAGHFPGLGTLDRSLDEEISTVQRTLDRLEQIDLEPFFAAMRSEDLAVQPDGVMVSHIRFRGLEGGRFVTTRPISVDSQVLQHLLALPDVASWRANGGVTVSDSLGVRALRRFYDPSETTFSPRRIAQDAFLAGNDILLLSHFSLSDDWEEQAANVESTITFFQEKYETDPAFQVMVDAAVARILQLKLKLYGGNFELIETRLVSEDFGERIEQHRESMTGIARDAVTLLSPPSPDLFPAIPTYEDRILIFTDASMGTPCAGCDPVHYIDPQALRNTIIRLYGPGTTGQINPALISSFTLDQMAEYLDAPSSVLPEVTGTVTTTVSPVQAALRTADWIIFAVRKPDDDSQFHVLRRFLAEQADALRTPHIIVLVYDAPYYLDATEISKLSAYYAIYSHTAPFIEASVRALFQEFIPSGAPPVSVPGINYDLAQQTLPDPNQAIAIYYEVHPLTLPGEVTPEPGASPTPSPTPSSGGPSTPEPIQPAVGDELRLSTGVIVDHNGHPVPDGTPVQFIFTYPREGLEQAIVSATYGGVAEATLALNRTGQLDISIQADPVPRTVVLQITIPEGEQEAIILTPTPLPTATPPPTLTPSPEPEPTPLTTVPPTPTSPTHNQASTGREIGGIDLLLALVGVSLIGGGGYYLVRWHNYSTGRAVHTALWCVISGLATYVVYALNPPGVAPLREMWGYWPTLLLTSLGGSLPLLIFWTWRTGTKQEKR